MTFDLDGAVRRGKTVVASTRRLKDEKTIDGAAAIRLLKRAVRAKGRSYIDPRSQVNRTNVSCIYGDVVGAPACIVGHVIHAVDPSIRLRALNRLGGVRSLFNGGWAHEKVYALSPALKQQPGLKVTDEAREILSQAQSVQDRGYTWGEALDAALRMASRMGVPLTQADEAHLARLERA